MLNFEEFKESIKFDTYSGPPLKNDPKVGQVFAPSSGIVGTITNRQQPTKKPLQIDFPEVSLKNRLKNKKRQKAIQIIRKLYSLKNG